MHHFARFDRPGDEKNWLKFLGNYILATGRSPTTGLVVLMARLSHQTRRQGMCAGLPAPRFSRQIGLVRGKIQRVVGGARIDAQILPHNFGRYVSARQS